MFRVERMYRHTKWLSQNSAESLLLEALCVTQSSENK